MKHIHFKNGAPVMAIGSKAIIEGEPANITGHNVKPDDVVTVGDYNVSPWGEDNQFPQTAQGLIEKSTVLQSAINYKSKIILGQGVVPVKHTGYSADGKEEFEIIQNSKLRKFLRSRMARHYLIKSIGHLESFGLSFPEIIYNKKGDKPLFIDAKNPLHCRFTATNEDGEIERCLISTKWGETIGTNDYTAVPVLSRYTPEEDLQRKLNKRQRKFIFPVANLFSAKDYYPLPEWYASYLSGWLNVANKVPEFLDKMFDNQISLKWHIKIPYAYWDKLFPETEYEDAAERQSLIEAHMDEIEESLTDTKNTAKAIFSHFEINPHSGKADEQWSIEPLDSKFSGEEQIINSAAANSETLFSMGVNPSILGAGMPGGPYSGSAGSGSDIREAYLVNVALSWKERQEILDPLELFVQAEGGEDVELRFINSILTTLDAGSGTTKTLS